MDGEVAWHYTAKPTLDRILRDGAIRRAHAVVRPGERAAVWLSLRDTWEPSATRWRRDGSGGARPWSDQEMAAVGYARIGVPVDAVRTTWAQHRRFGGLRWADAEAIEQSARERGGDPDAWRASYKDLPRSVWACVQVSADGVTWGEGAFNA